MEVTITGIKEKLEDVEILAIGDITDVNAVGKNEKIDVALNVTADIGNLEIIRGLFKYNLSDRIVFRKFMSTLQTTWGSPYLSTCLWRGDTSLWWGRFWLEGASNPTQ